MGTMPRIWMLFAAVVVGSGAVFALVSARFPDLEHAMIPPFWWPLFVALAFELAIRPKISTGELPETPMGLRAGAVIGGAVLYQVLRWMTPGA